MRIIQGHLQQRGMNVTRVSTTIWMEEAIEYIIHWWGVLHTLHRYESSDGGKSTKSALFNAFPDLLNSSSHHPLQSYPFDATWLTSPPFILSTCGIALDTVHIKTMVHLSASSIIHTFFIVLCSDSTMHTGQNHVATKESRCVMRVQERKWTLGEELMQHNTHDRNRKILDWYCSWVPWRTTYNARIWT